MIWTSIPLDAMCFDIAPCVNSFAPSRRTVRTGLLDFSVQEASIFLHAGYAPSLDTSRVIDPKFDALLRNAVK